MGDAHCFTGGSRDRMYLRARGFDEGTGAHAGVRRPAGSGSTVDPGEGRMVPMPDLPVVPPPTHRRRDVAGGLGLACGLLALAAALLPSWVAPLYDPPPRPLQERAADWVDRLRDYATGPSAPERPAAPEPTNPWRSPRLDLASLLLAFAALALAAIAFVRREDSRVVACDVALGAGAVAAHSLVTALMVLLVALTAVVLAAVARRA